VLQTGYLLPVSAQVALRLDPDQIRLIKTQGRSVFVNFAIGAYGMIRYFFDPLDPISLRGLF
jgi:hypothetical protein